MEIGPLLEDPFPVEGNKEIVKFSQRFFLLFLSLKVGYCTRDSILDRCTNYTPLFLSMIK